MRHLPIFFSIFTALADPSLYQIYMSVLLFPYARLLLGETGGDP
jgi:hypothetical protein